MLATPGTPGGIGYAAALSAVTQVMSDLAGQLFARPSARVLARWLETPLRETLEAEQGGGKEALVTGDWKARQRAYQAKRLARAVQQQRADDAPIKVTMTGRGPEHRTVTYRPATKRPSPLTSAEAVSAAATADIGRRASRQHIAKMPRIADDNDKAVAESVQGPVAWMAEVIRTLLVAPVCFTCTVDGSGSLAVYPFGLGRCRQFAVREDDLSSEALVNVQYLALAADTWTDAAASKGGGGSSSTEWLVASEQANEAFDLAMDRIALVGALCKHVVRCGQAWPVVQQVLEAAVMAAAASADAVAAGYHDSLVAVATAIRLDQPPRPHHTPEAQRAALLGKAATAALYNTVTVDASNYFRAMQTWHTARPNKARQ